MLAIPINSLEDPKTDISRPDPDGEIASLDTGIVDLEEQNTPPKSHTANLFDNNASDNETSPDQEDERSTRDPTGLFPDENRDCYRFGGDDDSVNSMLEMMDTKDDPATRLKNQPSLQTKARRSLNKWRLKYSVPPPSLLGEMGTNDEDGDGDARSDHDDYTIGSYDCIALSSLREKLRTRGTRKTSNTNEETDEESLRSSTKSFGSDDGKSDATTATITDESNGSITESFPIRNHGQIYTGILACFLALILLLGIVVLSYSLYALRQPDGEESTVFTAEFWKEEIPKALAFWKDDEDDRGN